MFVLSVTSFPRVYGRDSQRAGDPKGRERWQNRSLSSGL
jgi:hypothetical protein